MEINTAIEIQLACKVQTGNGYTVAFHEDVIVSSVEFFHMY